MAGFQALSFRPEYSIPAHPHQTGRIHEASRTISSSSSTGVNNTGSRLIPDTSPFESRIPEESQTYFDYQRRISSQSFQQYLGLDDIQPEVDLVSTTCLLKSDIPSAHTPTSQLSASPNTVTAPSVPAQHH
ncbi:hypothetical protein V501_05472 [Pseudogymnoascus sp. VKM F-4519 (FW-2642)]|nr:hypothetical protein V501_05472 [Pseudogymnoascus sp. VKM F-4519 (FW-2642)]